MRILVTGATSQIGVFLIPRLLSAGHEVIAVSRKDNSDRRVVCFKMDLDHLDHAQFPHADVLIHIAGLHFMADLMGKLKCSGIHRVIAFSSTSVITKRDSPDEAENAMINSLAMAERNFQQICNAEGISWILFRPTLIYGAGKDKNIEFIRSMINTFGVFPVIGKGRALRQPVHADDLASACVTALYHPAMVNKIYNLSGGEILSYRNMVEKVFDSCGKQARIISVPLMLVRMALKLIRLIPRYRYLNDAMIHRMNMDMVFSHVDATRDFTYSPRSFQP